MKKTLAYMLSFVLLPAAVLLTAQAGDVENSLFSEKDLILATMEEATPIVLNGESVTISEEGVYVLSGEIANGGIRISLQEEGIVRLLLNGVSVRNASGAALYTENCKKVILTLAQGTVNTFSQTGADAQDEAVNAAIYSRDDLTVNGTGALVVEGGYQDGVNSRDTLKIVSGQVSVTARDDGLVGKDAVIVGGGTLSVTSASGDGVKATNTEEAGRGYVTLAGGDISIKTGGGRAAVVKSNQNAGRGGGPGFTAKDTTSSESSGMKGVKAATLITLSGANITVDSEDDAIHSNGDIEMTAGTLTLSTGDDGMHADAALRISGGEISITEAYEGVEATDITLSGGRVAITAADDGINGAGGDSGVQTDVGWGGEWGRHGRDMFSSSTGTLTVSGGCITVTADGDGIDVNGDITMSGGEVYVRGPESSGNGALDYDGGFTMRGGTLLAVGASGMAQGVSQPAVAGALLSCDASGAVEVLDTSGNTLLSFDAMGPYQSVVVYSDLLENGQSYTIRTGGSEQTAVMSTEVSFGGGFGGGRR